jgi:uncharacterized membrane protein YraQ (UPF0718 family)
MDIGSVLGTFSTRFLGIFVEAVPFLLLGTLISGLIAVFVSNDDLARVMPRHPVAATLVGSMLGFVFPVCECGVVPVTRRLYQKGLPVSVGVTFLLAAPVMNPIVLASTYAAFGWGPVLIGRYVISWVMAVAIGLLFNLQNQPQRLVTPQALGTISGGSANAVRAPAIPASRTPLLPGLKQALRVASGEFYEMGRYLIIGTFLAAVLQTLIPQETLGAGHGGPGFRALRVQHRRCVSGAVVRPDIHARLDLDLPDLWPDGGHQEHHDVPRRLQTACRVVHRHSAPVDLGVDRYLAESEREVLAPCVCESGCSQSCCCLWGCISSVWC